jgi:hypothetical protein
MANQLSNIITLNRRKMFTASAAMAIAGISTAALAQSASGQPDRALFEAIAKWQRGYVEQERIGDIQSHLEDLAGETEPSMPSELLEALDMPDGKHYPTDMSRGWEEVSLRNYAETGQVLQTSGKKLPNDGLRTDLWWSDISPSTRQRAAELLAIRLGYDEKIKAHWAEAEEAGERFDDIVSQQFDLMMEIVGMPVSTVEGLAAKCQMLLDDPMLSDHKSEVSFVAQSLIADIRGAVSSGVHSGPALKA